MQDKDYIEIYDKEGNAKEMELVFGFQNNDINYIIYKSLDNNQLFAAKYQKSIDEDFDSNLSEEELTLCNKVFEELKNDNK